MTNKPIVSVVIPAYNHAQYLPDAIQSLRKQTFDQIEIVIINDGSTDNTLEVLRKYAGIIRLISQENQGECAARNVGIENCWTEYIAFMDADDISMPRRIELQSNFLENHPEIGFVGSDLYYMNSDSQRVAYQRMPVLDSAIRWRGLTTTPCYNIMIRRSILEKFNLRYPVGIPYAGDYSFLVDLLKCTRAHSIPEALLGYRLHGGNVSNRNLELRLSFHIPVVLKSVRQELGIEYESDELIKKLSALLLEGVRHYPYDADDRAALADHYLELWHKFKEMHKSKQGVEELQREVFIQLATFALYPPLPSGWFAVVRRLFSEDKRLPLYLVGNTLQFVKNIQNFRNVRMLYS